MPDRDQNLQNPEFHNFNDAELTSILNQRISDYARLPAVNQEQILELVKTGIIQHRVQQAKSNYEIVAECQELKDNSQNQHQGHESTNGPNANDLAIMQIKKCSGIHYFQRDGSNLIIRLKYDDRILLLSNRGSQNGELRGDTLTKILVLPENQEVSILDAIANAQRQNGSFTKAVAGGIRNWIKSSEDALDELIIPDINDIVAFINGLANKKAETTLATTANAQNTANINNPSISSRILTTVAALLLNILYIAFFPIFFIARLFNSKPHIANSGQEETIGSDTPAEPIYDHDVQQISTAPRIVRDPVVEQYHAISKAIYQQHNAPELRIIRDHSEQEQSRRWCAETGNTLAVVPYTK